MGAGQRRQRLLRAGSRSSSAEVVRARPRYLRLPQGGARAGGREKARGGSRAPEPARPLAAGQEQEGGEPRQGEWHALPVGSAPLQPPPPPLSNANLLLPRGKARERQGAYLEVTLRLPLPRNRHQGKRQVKRG